MRHELKTHPAPFQAVLDGSKRFEYRRDDRGFGVGDTLCLREYDPNGGGYTGRATETDVTWVLRGGEYGVPDGFAVLSILRLPTGNMVVRADEVRVGDQTYNKHAYHPSASWERVLRIGLQGDDVRLYTQSLENPLVSTYHRGEGVGIRRAP